MQVFTKKATLYPILTYIVDIFLNNLIFYATEMNATLKEKIVWMALWHIRTYFLDAECLKNVEVN